MSEEGLPIFNFPVLAGFGALSAFFSATDARLTAELSDYYLRNV